LLSDIFSAGWHRPQQSREPLFEPSSIDPDFFPKNTELLREPAFAQVYGSCMEPGHKVYLESVSTRLQVILWGTWQVA
jgi:hypothetical protein